MLLRAAGVLSPAQGFPCCLTWRFKGSELLTCGRRQQKRAPPPPGVLPWLEPQTKPSSTQEADGANAVAEGAGRADAPFSVFASRLSGEGRTFDGLLPSMRLRELKEVICSDLGLHSFSTQLFWDRAFEGADEDRKLGDLGEGARPTAPCTSLGFGDWALLAGTIIGRAWAGELQCEGQVIVENRLNVKSLEASCSALSKLSTRSKRHLAKLCVVFQRFLVAYMWRFGAHAPEAPCLGSSFRKLSREAAEVD